jgi:hypothetical protein
MKLIFLFDQTDSEGKIVSPESVPFVTTPDKLNLRQLQPGVTSLGVIFEQKDEKGEIQQFFRQIINFPINLIKVFPTIEEEIDTLKQILADRIGQQAVEVAKAQAAANQPAMAAPVPEQPAAPPAAPAANDSAVQETKGPKVRKTKKNGK